MKIFFDIVIILITNLVILEILYILNPELSYYRKKSKVKKWKRHSIHIVENVDNLTELFLRVKIGQVIQVNNTYYNVWRYKKFVILTNENKKEFINLSICDKYISIETLNYLLVNERTETSGIMKKNKNKILKETLKLTEISFEDIVFDVFNNQYTPDEVLQVYYEKIGN
jgi:hypothetical protein